MPEGMGYGDTGEYNMGYRTGMRKSQSTAGKPAPSNPGQWGDEPPKSKAQTAHDATHAERMRIQGKGTPAFPQKGYAPPPSV
jgi:hypothetical protein